MSKTYEDGLNEAWEAARKVLCDSGCNLVELEDTFDSHTIDGIFNTYTASEVIERLEKHDARNKLVHVGDEIYSELTDCRAVVQRIDAWNRYECFTDNGAQFIINKHTFNDYWVKTGKNYPQIAEVLKQMKEGANDTDK